MQPISNASQGQHRAVGAALLWVSLALNQMPRPEVLKVTRLLFTSSCVCLAMVPCTCAYAAGCPVISPTFNPRNLVSSPNNQPAPDQSKSLDTQRAASTIPIGGHAFSRASECMTFAVTMLFKSSTPCWAWSL